MSDDVSQKQPQQKSWLERLSQSLSREPKDRGELVELLRDAEQREIIDSDDLEMLEGVLEVSETQVRDIMIPRAQVIFVDIEDPMEDIITLIINSGHSRFPVINENKDEIIGILFAKDLLQFAFTKKLDHGDIEAVLRKPNFTPGSKRVDVLLKEFQIQRNHMAIVADEYGKVAGLITIEDVLEEIVGDIEDEHDEACQKWIKSVDKQRYLIDALTPIEIFNEHFDTELSDEEFDTIGGLVTHHFGHLPVCEETVIISRFTFKVIQADKRRITQLEMLSN